MSLDLKNELGIPSHRTGQGRGPSPAGALATAAAGLLIAIVVAHYPMLASRFARTQADPADGRLNNYFLENGYRWLALAKPRAGLWDPPFFYPQTNVAAYSDLMLSFVPLYAPWRAAGLPPDSAMQGWFLCVTAANFGAALLVLRRCLRCRPAPAAAAAALFAAAAPRVSHALHAQLFCGAFPILGMVALYAILDRGATTARRRWNIALLAAAIACQFWGGFYNTFFSVLFLGAATALATCVGAWRRRLLSVVVADGPFIVATAVVAALLVMPPLVAYLSVRVDQGDRAYEDVSAGLVRPWEWAYPGPFSVAYRWLKSPLGAGGDVESATGCGLVTTVAAVAGLWVGRRRPGVRLLACCSVAVVALATVVGGQHSLWWYVYRFVPGAGVIRAPGRVAVLLVAPVAVGVAMTLEAVWDHWAGTRRRWLAVALAGACLAEQAVGGISYPKADARERVAAIVAAMPAGATCFYYDGPGDYDKVPEVDAMWAALATGVPTIDGYSGGAPPDYPMPVVDVDNPPDRRATADALATWTRSRGLDPAAVAWIEASADGPTRVVRLAAAAAEAPAPDLAVGTRIDLGSDAADRFLGPGWSYAEGGFRWTDGPVAEVRFALSSPLPQAGVLSLAVQQPYLRPPRTTAQRVTIRLNGHVVCHALVTGANATIDAPLPPAWLAAENHVELSLPDAAASDADPRTLGIAVASLSLSTATGATTAP